MRIWCLPHQMDLVVKNLTEGLEGGSWVDDVYALSVYLRNQATLIVQMQSKCPKKTNRWMHLGMVLDFLIQYEVRILAYIADKLENPGRHAVPPELTHGQWVITHAVAPVIRRINRTFVELQGRDLLLCQQREYVQQMVVAIVTMLSVSNSQTEPIDEEIPPADIIISGDWWVKTSDIVTFIQDCSRRSQRHYDQLDADADISDVNGQAYVVHEIGVFVVNMITGLVDLQAERDGANGDAVEVGPPVTPAALAKLRPSVFRKDVLDPRRVHIGKFWSEEEIEEIEDGHKTLFESYRDDAQIKAILDAHTHITPFNEAWDALGHVLYGRLRRFAGGLATVFANTTSIESDFSILKWEKDEYRSAMMDLTLEGIFQSKQFDLLADL